MHQKDTWHRSGAFIINFWTYFTPCFSVSIVNFEHVIAGWVVSGSAVGIEVIFELKFNTNPVKFWELMLENPLKTLEKSTPFLLATLF